MSYRLAAGDSLDLLDFEVDGDDPFTALVGESDELAAAVQMARRFARRPGSNVLLVGETGTGKEVFARAIHGAGPHGNAPFVAVNSSAIPETLLESELFGHEKGAFTGAGGTKAGLLELAGEGTLFLDEVSSLPIDLQPKLLRALEERRVRRVGGFEEIDIRCRVIAATNEPLEDLVDDGAFRADLFYRLNVLRIVIPPLRARAGDVSVLAEHLLGELSRAHGLPLAPLSTDALRVLERHDWPGNVRELKNVLDRALAMSEGAAIRTDHVILQPSRGRVESLGDETVGLVRIPPEGRTLSSVEAEVIALTLELTGGNKTAAARILGISRPTIHRKIDEYGLREAPRPS